MGSAAVLGATEGREWHCFGTSPLSHPSVNLGDGWDVHLQNKHTALQSNFKLQILKHFTKKASLSNVRERRVGRVICLGLSVGKRKSQALPCPQAGFYPLNLIAALALLHSSPDQTHGTDPGEIPGKGFAPLFRKDLEMLKHLQRRQ